MELGSRIRALRTARGLSQETIAERLQVSRQAVAKWESGASLPSTANLLALCELFGISMNELTGRRTRPPRRAAARPLCPVCRGARAAGRRGGGFRPAAPPARRRDRLCRRADHPLCRRHQPAAAAALGWRGAAGRGRGRPAAARQAPPLTPAGRHEKRADAFASALLGKSIA